MSSERPRILVVDDEEAILETMTFTFEDEYEVRTSSDPEKALEILDREGPFAVVLSDQRMPGMSGVELVSEVCKRHPATVRIILTGFSDMDAIIQAINDGHVYSYITKPWEPDQLKQVMKQAVDHHQLSVENSRLLNDLQRANLFLAAVMDELDLGAIAVDAHDLVQAVNRPVKEYLSVEGDPRGATLDALLERAGFQAIRVVASESGNGTARYHDVDIGENRFRVSTRNLNDEADVAFGRVILFREVSHEPLQRRFNDLLGGIIRCDEGLRELLEQSRDQLRELADEAGASEIRSAGMSELLERISRARTAVENWLEVDDVMSREEFPDAQLLQDRLRIAMARWPLGDEVPERVRGLAKRVEDYYESGEKSKQRAL